MVYALFVKACRTVAEITGGDDPQSIPLWIMGWYVFGDKYCSMKKYTLPCSLGGKRLWAQGSRNRAGRQWEGAWVVKRKNSERNNPGDCFLRYF